MEFRLNCKLIQAELSEACLQGLSEKGGNSVNILKIVVYYLLFSYICAIIIYDY